MFTHSWRYGLLSFAVGGANKVSLRDGVLGDEIFLADVVFFDFSIEGSFADAEHFGGHFSIAVDHFQGAEDGGFFEFVEVDAGQVAHLIRFAGLLMHFERQIGDVQKLRVGQDHHGFDAVAQFP